MNASDSATERFEAAVDAVVSGDADTLTRLLREDAGLVHARSAQAHHATLLNYVGANGVEAHRQKSPTNAVAIARILLDAGAEIDAAGDMYGGTTTLGLVATSIHPLDAGVQDALIASLLERGASMERAVAPDYRAGNLVDACLANGRPEAAVFLAARGAPLTLPGAAGIGRVDVVARYFDGVAAKPHVPRHEVLEAFAWACAYGRMPVIEFLLANGVDPASQLPGDRHTALHAAAVGGHADIVRLLLDLGVPLDAVDATYGNTPLGWALYGWSNAPKPARARFREVARLLVDAGAAVNREWTELDRASADPERRAILGRAAR